MIYFRRKISAILFAQKVRSKYHQRQLVDGSDATYTQALSLVLYAHSAPENW